MGYVLILIGLCAILSGLYILTSSKSNLSEKSDEMLVQKDITRTQDDYINNKLKGDNFERFVVSRFDSTYFTIQEWRGDKYVDGKYAVSNHFPDLEIKFNLNTKNIHDRFAIECKYRSNYFKNAINWAENYQIENYKKYATSVGLPVFVIIGVGSEPQNPTEVFIVPLTKINSEVLSKELLSTYRRNIPASNFFWNSELKTLQ